MLPRKLQQYRTLTCSVTMVVGLVSCQGMTKPIPSDAVSAQQVISGWKTKPQQVAKQMMVKYGPPNEVPKAQLIWHNNGPWKQTEVVNKEIPHLFPKPHKNMLYQTIDYHVPPDAAVELARYDGSVIIERTIGQLAARCDMEEANFMALNLANEIVHGKKTVEEAREFYAEP